MSSDLDRTPDAARPAQVLKGSASYGGQGGIGRPPAGPGPLVIDGPALQAAVRRLKGGGQVVALDPHPQAAVLLRDSGAQFVFLAGRISADAAVSRAAGSVGNCPDSVYTEIQLQVERLRGWTVGIQSGPPFAAPPRQPEQLLTNICSAAVAQPEAPTPPAAGIAVEPEQGARAAQGQAARQEARQEAGQGPAGPDAQLAAVQALRARLWRSGYRPVAVYNHDSTLTASPGKAPAGAAWRERALRDPPEAAIAPPDPEALNTGILCDGLRAIDIDVDNETLAVSIRDKALAHLGDAPIRSRENSPRVLLLYRPAEGTPRKRVLNGRLGKVEVLGAGQQFVADGTHPSGAQLVWSEPLDMRPISTLTAVTEEQLTEFFEDAAGTLCAAPDHVAHEQRQQAARPTGQNGANGTASRHGLRGDINKLREAISVIPNGANVGWDEWNVVGLALWNATGGTAEGNELWHAWSAKNSLYDAVRTDARWAHYPRSPAGSLGAGTLFFRAREAREPPPPDHDPHGDPAARVVTKRMRTPRGQKQPDSAAAAAGPASTDDDRAPDAPAHASNAGPMEDHGSTSGITSAGADNDGCYDDPTELAEAGWISGDTQNPDAQDARASAAAPQSAASEADSSAAAAAGNIVEVDFRKADTGGTGGHDAEPPEDRRQAPRHRDDVVPLGHNRGRYYYFSASAAQIVMLTIHQHTKIGLMGLAGPKYWARMFPKEDQGINWDIACGSMMQACRAAGIFDPDRTRGRGAWLDNGRPIFHLGDALLVNGKRHPLTLPGSSYVYEAGLAIPYEELEPLTKEEAAQLSRLCKRLRWKRPLHGHLMAGWMVAAMIGGALDWRPNLLITGASGSGKSWLQTNVMSPVIGFVALQVQSSTSEAGIRQTLYRDALPILFDEFEGSDKTAHIRIQAVLDLMRQSTSEGKRKLLKGTAAQAGAIDYRIRSSFCFSAVNSGTKQRSDASRLATLDILNPEGKAETIRQEFDKLVEESSTMLTTQFRYRLLARTVMMIPVIRESAKIFAKVIAEKFGTQRMGDQFGTMFAGEFALHSDDVVTTQEARDLVAQFEWTEETARDAEKDEADLLATLMNHHLRMSAGSDRPVTFDMSIGKLIAIAFKGGDGLLSKEITRSELRISGFYVWDSEEAVESARRKDRAGKAAKTEQPTKQEPGVFISTNHPFIRKALEGTPWADCWSRSLCRLQRNGSRAMARTAPTIRFGTGCQTAATWLPLRLIDEDLAEEIVALGAEND